MTIDTVGRMFDDLKLEGARRSSPVRALLLDGVTADIVMVEADDDGTIYLKLEVNE